jgi:leader peptidase (prepilin peptidase)/N-methyltransferase
MLGAWLGWEMLPFIVLLSSLLGSIMGVSLILTGKHSRSKPIPFGPYLAVAGWVALIWGEEITDIYLKLL